MTPEEFVAVTRLLAVEQVVSGQLEVLKRPPGRSPRTSTVRRSEWFNSLSEADQAMVADVLRVGASSAIFRLLVMLDGGTATDDAGGELRLYHVSADGSETLLNGHGGTELHEEFGPVG